MSVEGGDVLVDGGAGDAEGGGDLLFGVAVEEEIEDLALAGGELAEARFCGGGEFGCASVSTWKSRSMAPR